MREIMINLTFFENVPPCDDADKKECILASKNNAFLIDFVTGEAYEYATFLSVEKKDIEEFERNIAVLKSYYDDFKDLAGESQKKDAIIGLYLLYLLSYNK